MIRPYVTVNLTTGFGNNLFQYSFARMLAEYHNLELATRGIKELGINSTLAKQKSNQYSTKTIKHRGYQTGIYQDCFTHKYENRNLNIASGYFEDYTLYTPNRKKIISWFPINTKRREDEDLILHFRLQNRLIQTSHFLNLVDPDFIAYYVSLVLAKGAKLHIITDSSAWESIDENYINDIKTEVMDGQNAGAPLVPTDYSITYFNKLVESLSVFKPIIHCAGKQCIENSGGLKSDFIESFKKYIHSGTQYSLTQHLHGGRRS